MGNTISRTAAESRLSKALPPSRRPLVSDGTASDSIAAYFDNEDERKRFIGSILALVSQNGKQGLERHEFALAYSRNEDNHVVASLVAVRDGVIEAKLQAARGRKDEVDAFRSLKMEIERRLDLLLQEVPNALDALPATSTDAPPAYDFTEKKIAQDQKV